MTAYDGASPWVCLACAVHHEVAPEPPARCDICVDDRQFVPPEGQRWQRASTLAADHSAEVVEVEPDLFELRVDPPVGIGQRTLLVRTPGGNLLWEPSGALPGALLDAVRELGGVAAVAASHPHLVGAAASWARACDAPYLFHRLDRRWLRDGADVVRWWEGSPEVLPGLSLVRVGGHFPGSAVAHWAAGAGGRGELLTGDSMLVTPGRDAVSFMRSYPNLVPLPPRLVQGILDALEPLAYDRLRSGFGAVLDGADLAARGLPGGAHAAVRRSAERYLGWLTDTLRDPDDPDNGSSE